MEERLLAVGITIPDENGESKLIANIVDKEHMFDNTAYDFTITTDASVDRLGEIWDNMDKEYIAAPFMYLVSIWRHFNNNILIKGNALDIVAVNTTRGHKIKHITKQELGASLTDTDFSKTKELMAERKEKHYNKIYILVGYVKSDIHIVYSDVDTIDTALEKVAVDELDHYDIIEVVSKSDKTTAADAYGKLANYLGRPFNTSKFINEIDELLSTVSVRFDSYGSWKRPTKCVSLLQYLKCLFRGA